MKEPQNIGDVLSGVLQNVREAAQEPSAPHPDAESDTEGQVKRYVAAMASQAGMSAKERTATPGGIPDNVRTCLAADHIRPSCAAISEARPYPNGFGLAGSAGVGKTMALATMFLAGAEVSVRRRLADAIHHSGIMRPWFLWVRWPHMVNDMRIRSTADGGLAAVGAQLDLACSIPCLVLDDLGAERTKGDYETDWVASQLDLLIDRRNGAMLPTWYTTNLSRAEFLERYGSRMFSRLTGDNPFLEVAGKRDMRVLRMPAARREA